MKRQNKELMRLQSVIENDRISGDGELIISDLTNLLGDYFDLKTIPTLSIEKDNGAYRVNIEFTAVRVKPFGVIPK